MSSSHVSSVESHQPKLTSLEKSNLWPGETWPHPSLTLLGQLFPLPKSQELLLMNSFLCVKTDPVSI